MQQRETKASGGDGDGDRDDKRHSTPFDLKPTDQPHSTRKQRESKEKRESGGDVDGDRWWWRSMGARGRKIDAMRERKSYAPERVSDEMRKRKGGESQVQRGERKNY